MKGKERREKVRTFYAHSLVPEQVSNVDQSLICLHPGCGEPMECESKMDHPGSPDREGGDRDGGAEGGAEGMADCEGLKGGAEETEDSKKRKRKPYRPGKPTATSTNVILRLLKKAHRLFICILPQGSGASWCDKGSVTRE